jgi:hypothetical protein
MLTGTMHSRITVGVWLDGSIDRRCYSLATTNLVATKVMLWLAFFLVGKCEIPSMPVRRNGSAFEMPRRSSIRLASSKRATLIPNHHCQLVRYLLFSYCFVAARWYCLFVGAYSVERDRS